MNNKIKSFLYFSVSILMLSFSWFIIDSKKPKTLEAQECVPLAPTCRVVELGALGRNTGPDGRKVMCAPGEIPMAWGAYLTGWGDPAYTKLLKPDGGFAHTGDTVQGLSIISPSNTDWVNVLCCGWVYNSNN